MIISIDIETTGLNPRTCQILEIGACYGTRQFHCYVDNDIIYGEPYALQMNHAILKIIADGAKRDRLIRPEGVANQFAIWLKTLTSRITTIAGQNFAAFDKQFLDRLPGWKEIKFDHRIIDVGNLYWEPSIDGDKLPNLKKCMQRAGLLSNVPHTVGTAYIVQKLVEHWKQNEDNPTD